jgi:hypothetical protein
MTGPNDGNPLGGCISLSQKSADIGRWVRSDKQNMVADWRFLVGEYLQLNRERGRGFVGLVCSAAKQWVKQ